MVRDLARPFGRALALAAALLAAAPGTWVPAARAEGIHRTAELRDPALRELRRRMIAGKALTAAQLRALADAGDGLAAFRLAGRLDPATSADPAAALTGRIHYYAIALYTGRDFAAPRLVAALDQALAEGGSLSPAQARSAEDALLAAAGRGNPAATLALVRLYLGGPPFGPRPDDAQALMLAASSRQVPGIGRAALTLGLAAIGPDPLHPVDPETSRLMLKIAAQGDDLAARTTAENLLRAWGDATSVRPVAAPWSTDGVSQ